MDNLHVHHANKWSFDQLFPALMHSWNSIPDTTAGRNDFRSSCQVNISFLGRSLVTADFVVDGVCHSAIRSQINAAADNSNLAEIGKFSKILSNASF